MMQKLLRVLFVLVGIHAVNAVAAAETGGVNSIDNVEFSQDGTQTLVKVTFKDALLAKPASFTTSNPYRIAFDFPQVASNLGVTTKQAGVGALQSVAVIQGDTRSRLVLNLSGPVQHTVSTEGNALYISLAANSDAVSPASVPARSMSMKDSGSIAPPAPLITNVDFRAISLDQANIKIDLTDPNALLDVKQQGGGLVLFFSNADVRERLEKRLDVRDFGTPVTTLTTNRSGKGVQISLANRGEWDYSVRQIDSSVMLEVRRIKADPNNLASARQIQGKVVSFNFTQPVPINQMIGIFQDISGLNFMVMPGVSGEIQSLKMENTPITVAIDVISRMYGLAFRRYGDIVIVGRADDLAKYDKEERDRASALEGSEPIVQESFRIRYRPANEIMDALLGVTSGAPSAAGGATGTPSPAAAPQQASGSASAGSAGTANAGVKSLVSSRGSVAIDPVTNTLFIEETKGQLDKIRDRITVLDKPIRQVMIEARLVEVEDSFFNSLGMRLTGGKINYSIGGTSANMNFDTFNTTQSLGAPTGASTGNLSFSLFNSTQTKIVNLALSAVESDSKSKTIASPKILSRDMQKATLMHGEQIPYATVSNGGTQTTFINAVVSLDVTPQIQQDGKIFMKLNVTMDARGTSAGSAGFSINKRQITTQLVVENGGTVVVGGMYKQVDADTVERIPFFGDLPYIGFLFKNKTESVKRNELLVFITPRVVSEDLVLQ